VAKYGNECVCVYVCLSVCPWAYLPNLTRDLYLMFGACCLSPWPGPPPAGWRNPKGEGQFWGFSFPLTMHCTEKQGPNKNGWTDRDAVWVMTQVGPRYHVLDGGPDPPRERDNLGGNRRAHCKVMGHYGELCKKRLNWSRYRFGWRLGWAEGTMN